MFYRRKVILALLQTFGGNVGETQLRKLLLRYAQKQAKPEYDLFRTNTAATPILPSRL